MSLKIVVLFDRLVWTNNTFSMTALLKMFSTLWRKWAFHFCPLFLLQHLWVGSSVIPSCHIWPWLKSNPSSACQEGDRDKCDGKYKEESWSTNLPQNPHFLSERSALGFFTSSFLFWGESLFHFLSHIINWKLCRVTSVQTEVSPASVRIWITDVCRRHCDMAMHRRKPSEKKQVEGCHHDWNPFNQGRQTIWAIKAPSPRSTGKCRSITVLIFYSWRPHCPMVCTREHLLLIFGFCVWYPSFKKVLKRSWSIFQDSCIFPALWKDCPGLEPVVILRKLIVSFPAAAVGDRRAGKSQLIVHSVRLALCLAGVVARGSLKISFQIQLSLFWP